MSPFSYRILVVDDEKTLRTIAATILKSQGYEVLCAVDGFDGLTKLKQSLPDVVISDLRMPNMSGFEFLSVVRKRFPRIAVIAISGEFSGIDVPESVLQTPFLKKASILQKTSSRRSLPCLKKSLNAQLWPVCPKRLFGFR